VADDRHYVPGDFYRICDRSGFKIRARRTQMEWNGLIVSDKFYEARQPQDFVKGVPDNQTVPYARPRQTNTFLGPLTTTLTANVAAAGTTLPVVSSVRMIIGDVLSIMLDTGVLFRATISSVPDGVTIVCNPKLPYSASAGNLITDLSAVSSASIG
jgi:hypothetical protein